MSIKSKALGVIGAGILSLSVFTGAALADTAGGSGNASSAVVLQGASSYCVPSVQSSSLALGTFAYDQIQGVYTLQSATASQDLVFNMSGSSYPSQHCSLTIRGTDLHGQTNYNNLIPVGYLYVGAVPYIAANVTGGGGFYLSSTDQNLATGVTMNFTNATAPISFDYSYGNFVQTLAPDNYGGTITVTGGVGA